MNPSLYKLGYDTGKDFAPISRIGTSSNVLVVPNSVPAKTLQELLALARAQPGTLTFATAGNGTSPHLAGELLKSMSGIDIVHVPYKGSTGMRTDILSGNIQILFDSVPTMAPLIEAGKVRALGTTGRTRSPILPNVPAIAETVPGFAATLWVGFMAPAATPQPIIDKLNGEISKILSRDDIHASWKKQGAVPLIMTQARFTEFMNGQVATWAKVIQDNHIALIK
jgi:tripartite-type tricarboxylate transporter receptor subunit TctC